jgi:hypothetical protein
MPKEPLAENRLFTLRRHRIKYGAFCEVIRKIAALHERGIKAKGCEGLLIVGQSGGGKSAAGEFYEAQFPRFRVETGAIVPVLRVSTPESPTVKTFVMAMLDVLGDPAFDRGTAEIKTQRLAMLLRNCKVELIIIDEFQHFYDGHRASEAKRITDWLKNLLLKVQIPVVVFGLPKSIAVLNLNQQLRRRFASPHYLRPFGLEGMEFAQLRGVLKTFHAEIPVPCEPLHSPELAKRFYFATNGLIDYIVKIIDGAVTAFRPKNGEALGLPHLAAAFRAKVWGEAPDELNPFCERAVLRPLMGPREPFDQWDDPKRYTARPRRTEKKRAK